MDYDRKSTSSFYGARKGSADALNREYAQTPGQAVKSRDDASSFFQPDGNSVDYLNSAPRGSAGYNRGSFYPGGREEPLKGGHDEERDAGDAEAWDVYADFNNAGPRYSNAYGMGQPQTQGGYSKLPPTPTLPKSASSVAEDKVEMVTVPALGAEWGKDEMRDMTKSGRKEKKRDAQKQFWKSWNRGERGLFGKYLTRRVLVFCLFGLCCAIGIVLAFTIPRVPSFAFNTALPLVNATGAWAKAVPTTFSRAPTNFSFPAAASLQLNTQSSYLPVKFTHLHASVYDLDTNRLVGTGNTAEFTVPAKSFPKILLPLNFTYIAVNASDQTWLNFYDACKNKAIYSDGKRNPLKFRMVLDMGISGLPSEYHDSTSISSAECPIELSQNAA